MEVLSIIDIESKFNAKKQRGYRDCYLLRALYLKYLRILWKKLIQILITSYNSETNLNALDSIGKFPLFYKQTLSSFNECKQRYNFNNNNLCSYPIFFYVTSYEM